MVKIQRKSNGQTVVTVPNELAEAMELKQGDSAEWKIHSGSTLRLDIDD